MSNPSRSVQLERFVDVRDSPLGVRIEEFLCHPEMIKRLEIASEMERPAVEGVMKPFVEKFGTDLDDLRMRQFVGVIIHFILESRGWRRAGSRRIGTTVKFSLKGGYFAR